MLATGASIWPTPTGDRLQGDARAHVSAGPPPRSVATMDAQRYHLSAAIDDLKGCTQPDELAVVACGVVEMTGQLVLATCQSWTGSGKWLYRWLSDASARDRGTADRGGACRHRRSTTARRGGARGPRECGLLAAGGLPGQLTATLTMRSSPGRTVPRPSVLLVVSQRSPSGVASTVRIRPSAPSSAAFG